MIIHCPKCLEDFEENTDVAQTPEDTEHEAYCTNCGAWLLYRIYFESVAFNEEIMPKCELKHGADAETYIKENALFKQRLCAHCDRVVNHIFKQGYRRG